MRVVEAFMAFNANYSDYWYRAAECLVFRQKPRGG